jgi:hypothetical protein
VKAERARLAALMEKMQKEAGPDKRHKLMSALMCPQ